LLRTGYAIARKQKQHRFEFLVATGITSWMALHTILNVAAMVALVPLTGIPLPLVSYGGSSFVSLMGALGILARLAVPTKVSPPVRRLVRPRASR
jgi:cell division protein FtsW